MNRPIAPLLCGWRRCKTPATRTVESRGSRGWIARPTCDEHCEDVRLHAERETGGDSWWEPLPDADPSEAQWSTPQERDDTLF